MSNGSSAKGTDVKALLQELKTNRRTQIMLVAFVVVLAWLFWPDPPNKAASPGRIGSRQAADLDDRQMAALEKLPDVAKLDNMGQLPNEYKMHRDLFLFKGQPQLPPPQTEPAKPQPPTQIELDARAKKAAWDAMLATRPQGLRYIGFLETNKTGIIGAFFKGDEPLTFQIGHVENTNWKLVKLTDTEAEFQNSKYADMRIVLAAKDSVVAIGASNLNLDVDSTRLEESPEGARLSVTLRAFRHSGVTTSSDSTAREDA